MLTKARAVVPGSSFTVVSLRNVRCVRLPLWQAERRNAHRHLDEECHGTKTSKAD